MGRDIPEDVITVILSRLSVKSLLRCKSVCKSWLSIISNPRFIKSHLRNAVSVSKNIPEIANILDPVQFLELQDLSFTCPLHIDFIVIPRVIYETLSDPRVVGCYNGIICLSDLYVTSFYLWNPSIRQCMKVPSPTMYECFRVSVSFGFDSICDDYKVLKIYYLYNSNEPAIIQVYSANANSWREFQSPIVQNWMVGACANTVVNGVLYIEYSQGLISFDLHTEVLGLVPFPSFFRRRLSRVLNFEDSVSMLCECVNDESVHLWTLNDVSGQMTWIKRNRVKVNLSSSLWLILYLGAGLFYGVKPITSHSFNVLYDYEKEVTQLWGPLPLTADLTLRYTESLVSVQGFRQVE